MTQIRDVLLIGGSGFLGSHVTHLLAARNCNVRVPTRRYEHAKHLILLPTVEVLEADVHDPAQLAALMGGCDAVVNLVGVLHSRSGTPYGPDFAHAHVDLPRVVAHAADAAGLQRLVHVSALGADAAGPSQYQRSKAAGEAAIRAARTPWCILRPSVMFGPGDAFLNLFASLMKLFPVMPLAGAATRFQPVCVEDVARVIVAALEAPAAVGQTFGLCGPRVYTLAELVRYVGEAIGRRRPVFALPATLAKLQATVLEFLPGPTLMSRDNLRSMERDNVCEAGSVLPFGVHATPLEAVAPDYLAMPRSAQFHNHVRTRARR